MMNKIFLDTNILLYIYATDETEKTIKAKNILQNYDNLTISTQVFYEHIISFQGEPVFKICQISKSPKHAISRLYNFNVKQI